MAEACRDLLKFVLAEAGFSANTIERPPRCLIDVGFGCGEQTIYLTCDEPVRRCDEQWWDGQDHRLHFDQYIGITQDRSQWQYAEARVNELNKQHAVACKIHLFCADAARPQRWSKDLLDSIDALRSVSQESWLLALDTAYHFSPSRWTLIEHAYSKLEASYMAFDLCISPRATMLQKIILRVLTALMGAPWANLVTPEIYHQRLIEAGYSADAIKIIDISEHVFAPLAEYMGEQDRRLNMLGLGLGSFQAARSLFRWWGSTGVVRGMVVVAKHGNAPKSRVNVVRP